MSGLFTGEPFSHSRLLFRYEDQTAFSLQKGEKGVKYTWKGNSGGNEK